MDMQLTTENTCCKSDSVVFEAIGGQVPNGRVRVSGAKNSATRLLAAALLTTEPVRLRNFPTEIVDARVKASFLRSIGVDVLFDSRSEAVDIRAAQIHPTELPHYDYNVRTTYLLAAGQLQRNGVARIPYPGGCKIGDRKYDLHIMVWEKMGCTVRELEHLIEIRCERLKGCELDFPFPTVGGTENAILCACIAEGLTIIKNAYVTPEVQDLIELLRHMGADIRQFGSSHLRIEGQDVLHGTSHDVISDRIEALTWIVYAILSNGSMTIEAVPFSAMEVPLLHLQHAGVDLFRNSDSIYVSPHCLRNIRIQPFELACGTHPGIISDMQPFYVLLALKADGRSRIIDYRYPDRVAYLDQLARFCPGAIEHGSSGIITKGMAHLKATDAQSTDLRGSMALILAALLADGISRIRDIQVALRGYNKLPEKLAQLGVRFELD